MTKRQKELIEEARDKYNLGKGAIPDRKKYFFSQSIAASLLFMVEEIAKNSEQENN